MVKAVMQKGEPMEVEKAIEIIENLGIDCRGYPTLKKAINVVLEYTKAQLPQKRTEKRTESHACDLISRQAAIKPPRKEN